MSKSKGLQGVFSKGYGTISKSIMTDTSLSLESKAIFAYFCALAGSGNKTNPYLSTITKQLGLSKNTYYKHYNTLIKLGFIIVIKSSHLLSSNTYQINVNQKDKKGYGIISREIMQDIRLSVKSKGLYAYICSLSGKNNHSFPSKRQILKQLNISEPTYHKCLNQLKECGYVFTKQRKISGRFSNNDYYLYSLPSAVANIGPDTGNNGKEHQKNLDTPHSNIRETEKRENKNWDTYLITFSSNNISSSNINQSTNDSLQNIAVNLINKYFPDAPHSKIINEFLPRFRDYIKGKDIFNLPTYMKSSINNFLEETAIKASLSRKESSYDLEELENLLNLGCL